MLKNFKHIFITIFIEQIMIDSVPPLLRILQCLLGGLGIKAKSIWGPSTSVSNTYFFCFVLFLLSSNPLSKANTALNKTTEF